jgi:hypothetical protein
MQSLELLMTTMSVKNPTCEEFTAMFPISMFQNRTSYYNSVTQGKNILTLAQQESMQDICEDVFPEFMWTLLYDRTEQCNYQIIMYYNMCS